ncbi:hypothetical protein AOQ84DRAFT_348717 [Glonium stellatum]|uniref:HORMA domain-containing protein n=1 Tax=Glonium stellatum TaxID=574774 RepID=A0A8E2JMM6_9PEZI|nr:hypothetical protein AOQ84DRAFT_348717 [Glonium stellatum]
MARSQATKARPRGTTAPLGTKQAPDANSAQRIVETTTAASTQVIKHQQSTEVIQTLLHGSVSCLSYLRNLFAERCFEDQFYETNDLHWSYGDYAEGKNIPREIAGPSTIKGKEKATFRRHGTSMKVLRRGRSKGVDQLLDWLEKGAFEALQRNVLRAIQLNIFEDPRNPSNVVEAYTFTFNYIHSPGNDVVLSGVEMQGPRGKAITVKNAKYAMQMFIRRLIALCTTLPDLPQRRYLNMHLFYTDDCDAEYEPPGFIKSNGNNIAFPEVGEWKKATSTCGAMDAGFHSVSLKVSHLQLTAQGEVLNEDEEGNAQIPNFLTYTTTSSREDDIDINMTDVPEPLGQEKMSHFDTRQQVDNSRRGDDMSNASKMARMTSHKLTEKLRQQTELPKNSRTGFEAAKSPTRNGNHLTQTTYASPPAAQIVDINALLAANIENQTQTQLPEDLQIKKQLQHMLEPPTQGQSLGDTQQTTQPPGYAKPNDNIFSQMPALQISQQNIGELEVRRNALFPPRKEARNLRRRSASVDLMNENDIVVCQCGWNEEEDDMINCSFCNTWQHLHCYGYRGSDDPRIPAIHACYQCLLQDKEGPLLRELKDLALLRRGVHIIETEGYSNDRSFSAALHCDLQTAGRVASHLRKQGYLVATPGSKKKDFGLTGKPKFSPVKAEPAFSNMMKEYYDPLTKIAHHFELPPPKELPAETYLTTQFPLPPQDSEIIPDSIEIDKESPLIDPEETQDEQSVAALTPVPSSLLRPQPPRTAPLVTRQAALHASAEPADINKATRYSLRYRNTIPDSSQDINSSNSLSRFAPPETPGRKRGRNDKNTIIVMTPGSKRMKFRSSMTSRMVNIGEYLTPSPAPKLGRSNML